MCTMACYTVPCPHGYKCLPVCFPFLISKFLWGNQGGMQKTEAYGKQVFSTAELLELARSKLHSESKHCWVVMKSSESQQTWEEERLQNWDEYSKHLPWIYPIKGYTQISGFRTIPATFAGCSLTRAIPTTPSGCSLTNILRGVLSPSRESEKTYRAKQLNLSFSLLYWEDALILP